MSKAVTVRIRDLEVWNRFKSFVVNKHGKLHTALGEELTEAIRQYLERADRANTLKSAGHSRKVMGELPRLKKAILEKVHVGGALPKKMLAKIIRCTSRVGDRRSVDSRIHALIADGFLEPDWQISPKGNVYRVMGDGAAKA